MLEFFKERLGEEKYNEILEDAAGKTYEEILDERDGFEASLKEIEEYIRSNEWAKDYENCFCRTRLLRMIKEALGDE